MPEFWQFPTVSMGLGPLMAIYQARFLKYLHARGIDHRVGAAQARAQHREALPPGRHAFDHLDQRVAQHGTFVWWNITQKTLRPL